jgi:SAM-dependent methyltransferase
MTSRHLDLGCGLSPRNPYKHNEIYGCDIREIDAAVEKIGFSYKRANVVVGPIPFPDGYFNSVSAFDFLEHIPREKVISVMDDIYRVLKPGGSLEHLTPSTDGRGAFSDPNHVSFWNAASWLYYTDDEHRALYGIKAKFRGTVKDIVTNEAWGIVHTHGILHAVKGEGYLSPGSGLVHSSDEEEQGLNICQQCGSDNSIDATAIGDVRQQFVCGECGHEWEAPI